MRRNILTSFIICLLCLGSFSCVHRAEQTKQDLTQKPKAGTEGTQTIPTGSSPETGAPGTRRASFIFVPTLKYNLNEMDVEPQTGQAAPASHPTHVAKNEGIKINVSEMPLSEFINLVFSKTLKESYYIDKAIEKKKIPITLKMEVPISPERFKKMVFEILNRCHVGVSEKDGVLFLSPNIRRKAAVRKIPLFYIGKHIPQEIEDTKLVGIIFPLYYINAKRYARLVKVTCLSRQGRSYEIPKTNSILILDQAKVVRSAAELLRLFDKPSFTHQTAVLIRLDYIPPKDFKQHLIDIMKAQGIPVAEKPGEPGMVLIPLPELNSIFIVSPKKEWIDMVRYWKEKLDDPSVLGDQPQLFVFYPQNRRAKDLAEVASKFESFGALTVNLKGEVGRKSVNVKKKIRHAPPTETGKRGQPSKVRIVVDEGRNALVILATPTQYQEIRKVLRELDVLPKEVMIKVTVAEITLSDQLQYGVEWYLRHSTTKFTHQIGTLGNLGIGSQGLFYSVIQETRKFQAAINAFAEKKLIKILSSPHLVVLDNHEASINVGTDVPIVTSETSASDIQTSQPSVLRNIEYRNTGVILNIKPTINSGGILTLDIQQEVSAAQTNNISPDISSPLILTRDIKTSVVLKSGMTLLLGGLIKNNGSSTKDQVPLLGDIPILGNLFKVTSKSTDRTELIVEITPYIIGNIGQAEEVTQKFRSLIKWYKK